MKKNDQSKIYPVTTKTTASQKAKFIQEAKKHNISLSEWVSGTLEMAINAYSDVNNIEQLEELKKQNENYIKEINRLNRKLNYYRSDYNYCNEKEVYIPEETEETLVYTRLHRRKLK